MNENQKIISHTKYKQFVTNNCLGKLKRATEEAFRALSKKYEVVSMSENMIKPLIAIKNYGMTSRVEVLGIDISKAVSKVTYSSHSKEFLQSKDETLNGEVTLTIKMNKLVEILRTCDADSKENVMKILEPYMPKTTKK